MGATMFDPLTQFWLASDAARLTMLGAGFWTIAGFAALMEWRRSRTRPIERLERVGWVPWTSIFLAAAFIGGGFLAMGVPAVLAQG
jgi:hypothetical protein